MTLARLRFLDECVNDAYFFHTRKQTIRPIFIFIYAHPEISIRSPPRCIRMHFTSGGSVTPFNGISNCSFADFHTYRIFDPCVCVCFFRNCGFCRVIDPSVRLFARCNVCCAGVFAPRVTVARRLYVTGLRRCIGDSKQCIGFV